MVSGRHLSTWTRRRVRPDGAITARATAPLSRRSRTAVVLNQAPSRGPLPDQAAEAINGRGLEVAPCRIGARVAFQHSLTNGLGGLEHEPAGKAASEIRELFRWVQMSLER